MPRCDGHESGLGWSCSVCGAPLSYRESIKELLEVPKVEPKFPRVAALFVGVGSLIAGINRLSLAQGASESVTRDEFVAAKTTGTGSWHDFHSTYKEKVRLWLKTVGFESATYRILVVDTTDPLSVLAISAVSGGSILFAVSADSESTPLQQNTSYVALKLAMGRGLPVIVCSRGYAHDTAFYFEGEGFQLGMGALSRVVGLFLSVVEDVAQSLAGDLRLGVKLHCFSATIGASGLSYRSLDDALSVQMNATSLDVYPDEVQTVFFAAFTGGPSEQEVSRSFANFKAMTFKNVVSADLKVYPKSGDRQLYNLLGVYGLEEAQVFPVLADGYQRVANRAPDLKVETLA